MIRLPRNKAIYFASTISDDTTEASVIRQRIYPGCPVTMTLAPAATLDAPDWAKHITLGFTLTPILVQPQAYSTTGDAALQFNWAIEAGYAPPVDKRARMAIGAFANFSSFTMPVGLAGFQMLESKCSRPA